MKKRIIALAFCIVLALSISMKPASYQAISMDADSKLAFLTALDEYLPSSVHYYHNGSVAMIDGLNFHGKILKVITRDNPKTEENEEVTEEYTSHIAIAFVEFEQLRDSLFLFKKTDFYYYDLDKKEFLTSNQVFINDEVKSFFKLYMQDIHKDITPFSQTLLMILISSILIVPILIMIFHNKGRSSIVNIYDSY